MRHHKLLIALAILVLIGVAGFFWWRSAPKQGIKKEVISRLEPGLTVASINISDISEDKMKLLCKVGLTNPLPVDINTSQLKYQLLIDSVEVVNGSYDKPISIKSSDSTVIEVPLELKTDDMARVLKYIDRQKIDTVAYTVHASFPVTVPIAGKRTYNLNLSKRLPALRIPTLKLKDVDLNILKIKKKGIDMTVQVTNPNVFPVKMKDAKYTINIEDDLVMQGALEKIVNIPARGTENVSMHADVEEGKVGKVGWKLLTDKKDTKFNFQFAAKILSENDALNNSKVATTMKGSLNDLLKAVKSMKEAE